MILELPGDERPRERMARLGASSLSSRELLASIVGTGARGASALDVAEGLLGGGLHGLASRSLRRARAGARPRAGRRRPACWPRWSWARGWPPTPARRRRRAESPRGRGRYLLPRYAARPVETFGLLALDARHRLRREAVISVGCLTASLVHPREVFQEAVVSRAAALVLFHNHPSGDPEPSAEDLALTRRLAAAGSLMGIEVLDHLVLGAGRYVSLKDRGHL